MYTRQGKQDLSRDEIDNGRRKNRGKKEKKNREKKNSDRTQPTILTTPIILGPKPIQTTPTKSTNENIPSNTPSASSGYVSARSKGAHFEPNLNKTTPSTTNQGITIKLIEENLEIGRDNIMRILSESTDYTIYGVLGRQNVGKSTLLSHLAGWSLPRSTDSVVGDHKSVPIFPIAKDEHQYLGLHQTTGIDVYVTHDRKIILDVQPILSASVLINQMFGEFDDSSFDLCENGFLDEVSLRIAIFILSICHVVLIVQDSPNDLDFLHFLESAMLIKHQLCLSDATISASILPIGDPQLYFVYNKLSEEQLTNMSIQNIPKVIRHLFDHETNGEIFKSKCFYLPVDDRIHSNGNNPSVDLNSSSFYSKTLSPLTTSFDVSLELFCAEVLHPRKLKHTQVSEKEWARSISRLWDALQRFDYSNLQEKIEESFPQ